LRATWSKSGGIAKIYHEKRTSGALRYLPGSSLSPVCADLLTADVIIREAHYDRILSHKYGLNVETKHIMVLPQKPEMKHRPEKKHDIIMHEKKKGKRGGKNALDD
jgi:hypothetical protein